MSLKKSLFKNSLASLSSKITVMLIRLLQVPLFISALGVSEYGHWLVISSLPAWLAISNLGFGSVAANDISMSVARGDFKNANRTFSTALVLITLIAILGSIIVALVVYLLPYNLFSNASVSSAYEIKLAIVWLSISVFVSFSSDILGGRLRAVNKAHEYIFISAVRPWLEFLGFFLILQFTNRFDYIALISAFTTILQVLIVALLSNGARTKVIFSIDNVHIEYIKELFKKGIAFQAFPLGNALLFQGNILVIQGVLGPVSVVLFSTARTLVRSINQLMEMINQVVWPEFSLMLGKKDYANAQRLHRIAVFASISAALISIVPLALWGVPIYKFWTGKSIAFNQTLLLLFLLPIPFNAIWYTSSVVHAACNKHEGLAMRYLIACSVSLLACYLLSLILGINGAATSTLFADIILIPFVLNKSILLTQDNWISFRKGMFNDTFLLIKNIFS
jgi:O-antigen/teichoic acid export membrane protein